MKDRDELLEKYKMFEMAKIIITNCSKCEQEIAKKVQQFIKMLD